MSSRKKTLPVRETMCATCPWRPGSKAAPLEEILTERILNEASHICHSTGSNNAFNKRTGKPPMICRGGRNVQLQVMFALGVIKAPTDEAWAEAWAKMKKERKNRR